MNRYYTDEDVEELALLGEYYADLSTLNEEYTEDDPFKGSLEDYGLCVSDFFTIEKEYYRPDPFTQTFSEVSRNYL